MIKRMWLLFLIVSLFASLLSSSFHLESLLLLLITISPLNLYMFSYSTYALLVFSSLFTKSMAVHVVNHQIQNISSNTMISERKLKKYGKSEGPTINKFSTKKITSKYEHKYLQNTFLYSN